MNAHEESSWPPINALDPGVGRVFFSLGAALRAERIVVVRIDGWFGARWLGFTGKVLGAFGVRASVGKRDRLPPPAFYPNRIQDCSAFERRDEVWTPVSAPSIHNARTSEANGRLRIVDMVVPETLVCWIGNDPDDMHRCCLMMYWIGEQTDDAVWACVDSGGEQLHVRSCVEPPGALLGVLLQRAVESQVTSVRKQAKARS